MYKGKPIKAMARPCCLSWDDDSVHCIVHEPNADVYHYKQDDKGVTYETLGGPAIGELECLSPKPGKMIVFMMGQSHWVYMKVYENGAWSSSWERQAYLIVMNTPSCVSMMPDTVDCMKLTYGNIACHVGWKNDRYATYKCINKLAFRSPTTVKRSSTQFTAFLVDSDNTLSAWHWDASKNAFDVEIVGEDVYGRPTAVSGDSNRVDVFMMSTKGHGVVHRARVNNIWHGWESLGGVFEEVPTCLTRGKDEIHCVGVGSGSALFLNSFMNNKWTGWTETEASFLENPFCLVSTKKTFTCFARDASRHLTEITFEKSKQSSET